MRTTELWLGCAIWFVIAWMVVTLAGGINELTDTSGSDAIKGWTWVGAGVAPAALILIAVIAAPFIKRGK